MMEREHSPMAQARRTSF